MVIFYRKIVCVYGYLAHKQTKKITFLNKNIIKIKKKTKKKPELSRK
jgi:hypothetical protein